jgi:cytochrome b involved in lipid metabolism
MAPNVKAEVVEGSSSSDAASSPEPQRQEILVEGYFYDVTDWIRRHPGGRIIQFYTKKGEDATLAVQQFHQRSTKRVAAIMASLKKRPASPQERKHTTSHPLVP